MECRGESCHHGNSGPSGLTLSFSLEVESWDRHRNAGLAVEEDLGFSNTPESLGGSEWLAMTLGTGTPQTLVLGRNKAETSLS